MNSKKIMLGVMLVWLAGVVFIVRGIGEVPPPPPPPAVVAAPPPPPPAPVVAELPPPPPPPAPPLDELQDFLPCRNGQTAGQGVFQNWRSHYDDQGRYVVLIPFEGRLGDCTPPHLLNPAAASVVYVDFHGTWKWSQEKIWEKTGPVRLARLGRHDGFIRLSVNFNEKEVPAAVSAEVLHKDQVLALRFTFTRKEPDKK
jgi:hypothetical protein